MKVLYKIPLALGCLIVLYGMAMFSVDRFFIQPSFEMLERKTAHSNLDRVVAAVLREGHHLATLDQDWSAWDDTYAFAVSRSPAYVNDNLSADSWKQTLVDLMAIYGPGGALLFEGSFDWKTGAVVPEDLFPRVASRDAPYLHLTADDDRIVGFVDSPRGAYVIASTPILHTNGTGPVRGSFLMGRLIDAAFAKEIAEQTSVHADLIPIRASEAAEINSVLGESGKTQGMDINRAELIGYEVVRDLWGFPVLLVKAHTPRDITAWSTATMRISLVMILPLALLFFLFLYLLLLRIVVQPLGRLQDHVRVYESDLRAETVPSPPPADQNEIESLASAFTQLGASLAAKRRELQAANDSLEAKVAERTTELRRASEHVRLLAKVVESTGNSVVITDLSGKILKANEAFCASSGYGEAELLGKTPGILKSGRHDDAFYAGFWKKLAEEGTWQGEIWDRGKNGEIFPRWLTVNLVRDETGEPSCYVGVSSDISNIKAAEDRLLQLNRIYRATSRANQLIVHEKNRLRLLMEICRIAVEDGGAVMAWIGFVDPATHAVVPEAWYGREENYLATIRVASSDVLHGRGPTGTAIRENRHVSVPDISNEPSMLPWREEALRRGYRSSAAFPLTEKGKAIGAFSAYAGTIDYFDQRALSLLDELTMDISYSLENLDREEERKKLEAQFQQAQKMEAVGRLAGGIAHDFNNILTVISGYSELGLAESRTQVRNFFLQIKQAARKAANLTSQLLTFSRRKMIQPSTVDVGELVKGMVDMLKLLVGEDIDMRIRREEGLWNVYADPGQLEQVVMNLVVNARDAMPHGGALSIRVSNARMDGDPGEHMAVPEDEYVRLEVRDTGHGMDEATLAKIYEPFFTTKDIGKGTGLGLATVYGIIRQAGGFIDCRSAVGKGTTFTIFLPRSREEETADSRQREPAALSGNETILLADDDEAVGQIASSILQTAGYNVIRAHDGTGTLAVASSLPTPPDLLITDVGMPGLNGMETARTLSEKFASLRVLYISGYAEEAPAFRGPHPGAGQLLRKPFSRAELLQKVRETLDSKTG